ncbi:fibronectin type III domain-containing protein [Rathayibacter caricis]|uniref:fibronectin type III domain-containing protein n=1 Tax=Rathayibacter caricis TaxID=110936 RepID=UPI001FB32013|nr:fibronectin type III domain-containing protein [Rathayibacter caricis]MCJ1696517.1 fibronectin type III domain-containing protein [Rathayibacter caricis]
MRKTAVSFSILLTLVLSLITATPANAAGSPAPPTSVMISDNDCSTAVSLSWTKPLQAVAGFRIHVYQTWGSPYQDTESGVYYWYSVKTVDVIQASSVQIDLPTSTEPYWFDIASVTDFSAPFTGGSDGRLLERSSTQSSGTQVTLNHDYQIPAPSNLVPRVDLLTNVATFTWNAPSRNGATCDLPGYNWHLLPVHDPFYRNFKFTNNWGGMPSSSRSVSPKFEPNVRYNFCVWAVTSEGSYYDYYNEERLSPSSCTEIGTGTIAPSAPSFVTSSTSGSSTTINWEPPSSDGGSPISGYRVARNGTDASNNGPWSTVVGAGVSSQTFTNLRLDAPYSFTVQTITSAGTSPTAVPGIYPDFHTVPDAPVVTSATTDRTARSATVTWADPYPNAGQPITGYRVSRNGTDAAGSGPWSTVIPASSRSQTFTNLAAGSSYTLTVRALVAGGEGYTTSTVASFSTGALAPGTPKIVGTAKVGATLTADPGTWSPAPVAFSYQWKADGVALSGATARTYQPSSATLGKKITVTVNGSKTAYTTVSRTTAPTAAVVAGTMTSTTPTITGIPRVGVKLTADPGSWGPAPVVIAYQWKADGLALSGATASTYTPSSATVGKVITVSVTGAKTGYASASRTSGGTAAVAVGLLTAPSPTVSGTAKVGSTLTAVTGAWGPSPVALTYQWKANGVAIAGATATSYKPTSTTVGKKITVTVIGKKTGYTTSIRTSAPTAAVVR